MDKEKVQKAYKRLTDRADYEIRQLDIALAMAKTDAKVAGIDEENMNSFVDSCKAYVNDRASKLVRG